MHPYGHVSALRPIIIRVFDTPDTKGIKPQCLPLTTLVARISKILPTDPYFSKHPIYGADGWSLASLVNMALEHDDRYNAGQSDGTRLGFFSAGDKVITIRNVNETSKEHYVRHEKALKDYQEMQAKEEMLIQRTTSDDTLRQLRSQLANDEFALEHAKRASRDLYYKIPDEERKNFRTLNGQILEHDIHLIEETIRDSEMHYQTLSLYYNADPIAQKALNLEALKASIISQQKVVHEKLLELRKIQVLSTNPKKFPNLAALRKELAQTRAQIGPLEDKVAKEKKTLKAASTQTKRTLRKTFGNKQVMDF